MEDLPGTDGGGAVDAGRLAGVRGVARGWGARIEVSQRGIAAAGEASCLPGGAARRGQLLADAEAAGGYGAQASGVGLSGGIAVRVSVGVTDANDLVLRLGRLAFTQPAWTPASGPKAELRSPFQLAADAGALGTVLAAVHFAASALTALADGDTAAISAAGGAGRLCVLTRTLPASHEIRGRYAPAPPGRIDGITAAYHLARDTTETLARQLDTLALEYGAPSTVLTRARAARLITLPPSLTATAAAVYPRRQGTVESQVRRTGTSDPGLLLHAAAIDSAAHAVLARAAADAAHVAPPAARRHQHSSPERPCAGAQHTANGSQSTAERGTQRIRTRARTGLESNRHG